MRSTAKHVGDVDQSLVSAVVQFMGCRLLEWRSPGEAGTMAAKRQACGVPVSSLDLPLSSISVPGQPC